MTDVYIESAAWCKLWAYITTVNTEIGGMGYAFQEGNCLVWKDTFLCPQVATSGEVDFDTFGGDEYAINKASEDGFLACENGVWVSWHSHNSMSAFWSTKDDTRIEKLRLAGIKYLLSFVGNHKFEYKLRLDYFDVNHHGLVIPQITDNVDKLLLDPQDPLFTMVGEDIQANLREKPKPNPQKGSSKSSSGQTSGGSASSNVKQLPGGKVEKAMAIKKIMDDLDLVYEDAKFLYDEGFTSESPDALAIRDIAEEFEVDFATAKQIKDSGWTLKDFEKLITTDSDAEPLDVPAGAILEGAH